MIRWRLFMVFLVLLFLIPISDSQDDEEDEKDDQVDGDENDDDDDEDDTRTDKNDEGVGRRAPSLMRQTSRTVPVTRTTKMRPLECYVCAYKSDTPLKACLDPTKFRVQTITCHSVDDKCSTSVISKGSSYEAVVRGCKSACIGTPETTCCDLNRCNNQAFALPTVVSPKALVQENKSPKTIPHSVFFFVTILLVLQTVVKVTFV
ncbi:nucleolar complex protein 2 homolog [Melitaea cinxia]|uniref:nucleolar complex protein 2 homolog n=1 Tax=Melitaea cinxia TaxID=113334 RepID=UPI001E2741F2|nr:nucleolar complex protein 2 homolog [Melitaea cinxia]